jgi:hypothetical protein
VQQNKKSGKRGKSPVTTKQRSFASLVQPAVQDLKVVSQSPSSSQLSLSQKTFGGSFSEERDTDNSTVRAEVKPAKLQATVLSKNRAVEEVRYMSTMSTYLNNKMARNNEASNLASSAGDMETFCNYIQTELCSIGEAELREVAKFKIQKLLFDLKMKALRKKSNTSATAFTVGQTTTAHRDVAISDTDENSDHIEDLCGSDDGVGTSCTEGTC